MPATIVRLVILIPVFMAPWFGTARAHGHYFFDIYGGVSLTADNTVHGEDLAFMPTETASRSVSYDPSFAVGGRVGWWFAEYAGAALDAGYFRADSQDVETSVVSLSLLFMARMHFLKDEETGRSRLQPYLAVGPGFFGTGQYVDFRPDITESLDVNGGGIGLDARLGLRWLFSERVGLFTEYRLTHFRNRTDDKYNGLFYATTTQRVNSTMTTHHALAGFSFAF
jgi:hypothetical protein